MILRARIVLPLSRPPIEDGAVSIVEGRIVAVCRWAEMASDQGEVIDLGESILLPGLINAHCHLDYTDLAGRIPPQKGFSDWIKAIVALKAEWSYTDFAQSWLHGAQMLLRTGTTTVLDVETVPELIPEMWNATGLRVISFRELINLKSGPSAAQMVETAAREWSSLSGTSRGKASVEQQSEAVDEGLERTTRVRSRAGLANQVGLSPHAPYSTTRELLQSAARVAVQHRWPLTTHVAESEQEFDMFMHRRGPLFDWLHSQRDMSDCGNCSPVQHLERCGYLSENLLAVHANYLWGDDVSLLARNKISVAHCPRSHTYFGHKPFPYAELAAAGINLCLGTDSLVSVRTTRKEAPELNMFAEMQAMARNCPEATPAALLRMATLSGAAALGRVGDLGELSPNALADVIVLPFAGPVAAAEEAVVHHAGEVAACMIDGQWMVQSEY